MKKKQIIFMLVTIIVCLILVVCCFFIDFKPNDSNKVENKEQNKKLQTEEKEEKQEESIYEIDESKYSESSNKLDEKMDKTQLEENIKEIAKIDCYIAEASVFNFSKDIILINELPDYAIANLAARQFGEYDCEIDINGFKQSQCWSKKKVENAFKNVFGNTIKPYNDNKVHGLGYTFTKDGIVYQLGVGDSCGSFTSEIIDIKQIDNVYYAYMLINFLDGYYNYEATTKIDDSNKNIPNYKAVFKQDNEGNYYFYGIERIR